jgi:hypothetical protein
MEKDRFYFSMEMLNVISQNIKEKEHVLVKIDFQSLSIYAMSTVVYTRIINLSQQKLNSSVIVT